MSSIQRTVHSARIRSETTAQLAAIEQITAAILFASRDRHSFKTQIGASISMQWSGNRPDGLPCIIASMLDTWRMESTSTTHAKRSLHPTVSRIGTSLISVLFLFGSLLTFPKYIPWIIFLWVCIAIGRMVQRKSIYPVLAICLTVVLIKRTGFTTELLVLALSFIAIGWMDSRIDRSSTNVKATTRMQMSMMACALLAATLFFGVVRYCGTNTSTTSELDRRPIACLGDSLTDFGYPQELEKRISVPVVDFGVNGITTDDGIDMLPEVLAAAPQAVILELGGHDYNADKKTRAATKKNLVHLIETFRDNNIIVILVEIPRGFVWDPYDGLERELAQKYDLQLIDDSLVRSFIFNSPIMPPGSWLSESKHYSKDGLHPNDLGNQHFADVVAQALQKVFGDQVLKN